VWPPPVAPLAEPDHRHDLMDNHLHWYGPATLALPIESCRYSMGSPAANITTLDRLRDVLQRRRRHAGTKDRVRQASVSRKGRRIKGVASTGPLPRPSCGKAWRLHGSNPTCFRLRPCEGLERRRAGGGPGGRWLGYVVAATLTYNPQSSKQSLGYSSV
jgi:hypothetical protein